MLTTGIENERWVPVGIIHYVERLGRAVCQDYSDEQNAVGGLTGAC